MKICPHCGNVDTGDEPNCRSCGISLSLDYVPPSPPKPADSYFTEPIEAVARQGSPNDIVRVLVGIVIVATLAAGGVWAYKSYSSGDTDTPVKASPSPTPTAKQQITSEIEKGNLLKPEGQSAYDRFLASENQLSADDKKEIGDRVNAQLANRGQAILDHLKAGDEFEDEWREGLRAFDWLGRLQPRQNSHQARRLLLQARLALKDVNFQQAETDYQQSLRLEPSSVQALNGLGRVYAQKARARKDAGATQEADRLYRQAESQYRRAINLDPGWIFPRLNLAATLIKLEDWEAVETAAREAIQLDPNKPGAHYYLAVALDRKKLCEEALAEFQKALDALAVLDQDAQAKAGFSKQATEKRIAAGCKQN